MAEALRCRAGGIAGLRRFLEEYGEAVEWDIARYWPGRSLLELYRGEMSWRELRVFLRFLPHDSATARTLRGATPEEDAWTLDRQLLATIADAVRESTFTAVKLHGDPKKTGRLKPPKPIPRPGVEEPQKTNVIRFGGRHGSGAKQLAQVFGRPAANQ
ncbi:hypothetical protein KEF29_03045 [Streptomyces tuirus]|uniref:Uncharacterized protein n=1 Tax=Streptomyces tuirus TaxID=68278 RepID=A0A941F8G8_9ACTN|nr:hypothetical protein [Streptomyces tuirus]